MSHECNHNCENCSSKCDNAIQKDQLHPFAEVKKVIAVVSGKGGVGKSSVTSMLAVAMKRKGYGVGILDADITGPSIPKAFGINQKAYATENGLYPVPSKTEIDVMSINLLLDKPTDPVVWRGPVIAGAVKQFWEEVIWENEDYLFVDMPPGTGDVPLTVFQSLPVDGIVIVTSPQDLVRMIVKKAFNMAKQMNIPVLGIVENYSYLECPDCGKKINVFGKSRVDEVAEKWNLHVLARLPINPDVAEAFDCGQMETTYTKEMNGVVEAALKI